MIETTEAVVCDGQDWQLYRNSQIADEIIRTNRHHPPACPFNNDVFDPVLKRMKGSEDIIDIDVHFLHQATHDGRRRRFQPNRINLIDRQPSLPAASRSSASRRSPQQIGFIPAQDVPDARNKCRSRAAVKRLAYTRIRPGDKEAHATCFTRSDPPVARFALMVCTMDRKIFAPSMLPSRASDARSG